MNINRGSAVLTYKIFLGSVLHLGKPDRFELQQVYMTLLQHYLIQDNSQGSLMPLDVWTRTLFMTRKSVNMDQQSLTEI